jgi:hypothetical protein
MSLYYYTLFKVNGSCCHFVYIIDTCLIFCVYMVVTKSHSDVLNTLLRKMNEAKSYLTYSYINKTMSSLAKLASRRKVAIISFLLLN